MTHYALHAHDLDPRRCTGIARYAADLTAAMRRMSPGDAFTLGVAAGTGVDGVEHTVIAPARQKLYLRWLLTRSPRLEALIPGARLIHATAPILPIPTALPLVVTLHDVLPRTNPEWYSRKEIYLFEASLRQAERKAAAVIVPTVAVAEQVSSLSRIGRDRIRVTGEGSSRALLPEQQVDGLLAGYGVSRGSYAVFVGSLNERKNLRALIQAWSACSIPLLLAGPDGVGAAGIHEAAAHSPRVRILGAQPDAGVSALMQGARALVHPSIIEGFGLTPLEAMSLGAPVITAGTGALAEVVGDAGLHPETNDVPGWRAVLEVLQDQRTLDLMVERGRLRAKEWTWELAAERTLQTYRDVA